MDNQGYIKLYRKILDNPISKKPEYCWLWCILLMKANHKETDIIFNGKKEKIKIGEFITGRKQLSLESGISESKIQRILKYLEIEHQIEQQTNNKFRRILIINYKQYQQSEQQNEQPVNNKRTTSEQPVNTNKNDNNEKNDNKYKKLFLSGKEYNVRTKQLKDGCLACVLNGVWVDYYNPTVVMDLSKYKELI
jgi:hypothetical protein